MFLFDRPKKQACLGQGISGTVDLYKNSSGVFVVKKYHCKEPHESRKEYHDRVLAEYHILRAIDHENFIRVVKYEVSYDGLTVKMFMDVGSANLAVLMKQAKVVPRTEVLCLWKQVCCGVRYLHGIGICHRDLKLENVVLDTKSGHVKIIDLATAVKCDRRAVGIVGSPRYLAPETASGIYYDGKAADIWSLGIIWYYLLNRAFPWKSAIWTDKRFAGFLVKPDTESLNQHAEDIGKGVVLRKLPAESEELAKNVFEIEPEKRFDIEQMFADPWFGKIRWCEGDSECGSKHVLK